MDGRFVKDGIDSAGNAFGEVIEEFERNIDIPGEDICYALQATLENAGGVGVRRKLNRSEVRRIAVLENEGGIVGTDAVP